MRHHLVIRKRTQSPVAFAISSPIFLGERPSGPILGARADWAPTSPPVALRWLLKEQLLAHCDFAGLVKKTDEDQKKLTSP